jgi:hypothetical protein
MSQRVAWMAVVACFSGLLVTCYWPVLFQGRQFAYRDAANYYYPLNLRVQAEWNAGRWPLWEPEENAGMPLLGNPTAAVLYPPKLIFALCPYPIAARAYVILHSALAFCFMLLLMRAWNTSLVGSAISSLAYAFGAPILFQYCNVIYLIGAAWLPLGFLAVDQWLRLGRRFALLLLSLVLAMQVLGGDPQTAYLLGLAAIPYAIGLLWTRQTPRGENPESLEPRHARMSGRRLSVVASMLVIGWYVGSVILASRVPGSRMTGAFDRAQTWISTLTAVAWSLLVFALLASRRARPNGARLGAMWLGLVGSAAFAAVLCAAQLIPVVEFIQQSGRGSTSAQEVYRYALDPMQLPTLFWPNILGTPFDGNDYWPDIFRRPGGWFRLWTPSLYLGGLTIALALGAFNVRAGPPWRIWLSAVAAFGLLCGLGPHASPIWMTRALAASANSAATRDWLPNVGPLNPVDPPTERRDGYWDDACGSVYWTLSTVVPGFRQFRYPAKLFTWTALAVSALAGFGWDHARDRTTCLPLAWLATLAFVSLASLVMIVVEKDPILAFFQRFPVASQFGPFQSEAGYRAIARGLTHATIVFGIGLVLVLVAPRSPKWAGLFALAFLAIDLGAGNARYVLTVPQSFFETEPECLKVIKKSELADPAPGPFRIHRMSQWFPEGWNESPSSDRVNEVASWERDTLFPKYGIPFGLEYTRTSGVAQLEDYERFFTSYYIGVHDRESAARLGVEPETEIVYHPRRAYDMWNTRYIIAAYEPAGWHEPARAFASFLFRNRSIYPATDRFAGPKGSELAKTWAEHHDFQVFRNLLEYPRAWVVHRARGTISESALTAEKKAELTREMLHAGDPLWNSPSQRIFDPRNVAWVSREAASELRSQLSGAVTVPSEDVKVSYPGPCQAVLEVTLDSPGLVILADVFYPGWTLSIDDKPAPIYRANGAMRGAAVGAGFHRLVYTYAPASFQIGLVVSSMGVILAVFAAVACGRWPVDRRVAGSAWRNAQ